MIIPYSECRSRFRIDSSAIGVVKRTVRYNKFAYIWLHASYGWEAEIVREKSINPALATGVAPPANVESSRDVSKSLRLQLQDKDKQDLQVQMASSLGRCLFPEQSVPYKIEIKNASEMRDILLISFAEEN